MTPTLVSVILTYIYPLSSLTNQNIISKHHAPRHVSLYRSRYFIFTSSTLHKEKGLGLNIDKGELRLEF